MPLNIRPLLKTLVRHLRLWRFRHSTRFAPLPKLTGIAVQSAVKTTPIPPRDDVLGVNLYGLVSAHLGIGEAARLYAKALIENDIRCSIIDVALNVPHARSFKVDADSAAPLGMYAARVNLVFVNPDYFGEIEKQLAVGENGARLYTIGFWFWELDVVPDAWDTCINAVDEIWVASSFIEKAFRKKTTRPVRLIPPPLPRQDSLPLAQRDAFGLRAKAFVFLCSFDYHSSIHRKNPKAVIDAFLLAFPAKTENVQLIIKSSNARYYLDEALALLRHAKSDSRIMLRDGDLSSDQMRALQASADAYVSLHRSEGFGLGIAEMMSMGKPVIATAWSGNLDFMDDSNSFLVVGLEVPVPAGQYPHPEGAHWAEPDVYAASNIMRALVSNPAAAGMIGENAKASVQKLSESSSASAMVDELKRIGGLRCREC